MEDSDSGVGSISYSTSTRPSSMSGDDRSTAGSRSSAASLPLSEVSSPAPPNSIIAQQQQQHHQDTIKIWRDPQLTETQIRHVHSVQHSSLLLGPTTAKSQLSTNVALAHNQQSQHHQIADETIPANRLLTYPQLSMSLLVPPPIYASDLWTKEQSHHHHKIQQQQQQQQPHQQQHHRQQSQQPHHLPHHQTSSTSHSRYEKEKQVRDWRELEYREMERHKEMERLDRKRQAQTERERQVEIAEQAVSKHFEESLRLAEEKKRMRDAGWNLNTLPPQHPAAQHMSHIGISAHVVPPSVANTTQSQMNAAAASPVQQLQDDRRRAAAAAAAVAEHDRIMAVERERERERDREMEQREREKPLPLLDRLRQQHQQQQRYYTSTGIPQQPPPPQQQPQQRTQQPKNNATDYGAASQQHRNLAISQSKSVDKMQQIKSDPNVGAFSMYGGYQAYPTPYHKDYKDLKYSRQKTELTLPTPPPLMSDIKQSAGVIVKHDTHKPSPIQVVHPSSKSSSAHQQQSQQSQQQPQPPPPHSSHYKPVSGAPSHLMYDYRQAPPPTSHDRYKGQSGLSNSQPVYIQQSTAQQPSSHHHSHSQQQQPHSAQQQQQQQSIAQHIQAQQQQMQQHHQQQQQAQQQSLTQQQQVSLAQHHAQQQHQQHQQQQQQALYAASQSKPKVSSPAPSHIYGKPSGAGIVSGIPVCRVPLEPPVHAVSKSASPSTFQSHVYVPPPVGPPPPAHSSRSMYDARMYPAPAVKQTHAHPMHVTSPPTASAAPLPISRSPGILMPMISSQMQQQQQQQQVGSLSGAGLIGAFQTQPLDLGVSDRNRDDNNHSNHSSSSSGNHCNSPKRKSSTPIHYTVSGSPVALDIKKKRVESPAPLSLGPPPQSSSPHHLQQQQQQHHHMQHHHLQQQQQHHPHHHHLQQQQHPLHHNTLNVPVNLQYTAVASPLISGGGTTVPISEPPTSVTPKPASEASGSDIPPSKSPLLLMSQSTTTTSVTIASTISSPTTTPAPAAAIVSISPVVSTTTANSNTIINSSNSSTSNSNINSSFVTGTTTINTSTIAPATATPATTVNATTTVPPITTNPIRTNSADGLVRPTTSENSSPALAPSPALSIPSTPATPAKLPIEPPEKSSSPALGAPRHLKKAWLQRHTGEDSEDTTGITGGGSCVKLPLTITPPLSTTTPTTLSTTTNSGGSTTAGSTNNSTTSNNNDQTASSATAASTVTSTSTSITRNSPPLSLHSIGSMAVNSINKTTKTNATKNAANAKKSVTNNSTIVQDNGHNSDSDNKEDSSSSDQDRLKPVSKRKFPKGKRRKGSPRKPQEDKKKKVAAVTDSDKDSDSEKESMSDKDSDSGTSTSQGKKATNGSGTNNKDKEPRKRGRRPKLSKDDALFRKKKKPSIDPAKDPFRKPPIAQLKKTGESFLQDGPCFEVAPKLGKCRECRWTPNQRSKNTPNIFCRFYAFRRLRYTKNGLLAIHGFSDPSKDPLEDDKKLWMPDECNPPTDLDMQQSRFLLAQVGDQFCDLLVQERNAIEEHISDDKVVAWKRVVQGVREMCDVCETTLFNYHWACGKCGFVVCLDCYKSRKHRTTKVWGEINCRERDDFSWLLCTNRTPHELDRLMLTQIIAGDSLMKLGRKLHEIRILWGIPANCDCQLAKEQAKKLTNGVRIDLIKNVIKAEVNNCRKLDVQNSKSQSGGGSALSWLADVALNDRKKNGDSLTTTAGGDDGDSIKMNGETNDKDGNSDDSSDENGHSTLRELLIRPAPPGGKTNGGSPPNSPSSTTNTTTATTTTNSTSTVKLPPKKSKILSFDEIILAAVDKSKTDLDDEMALKLCSTNEKNSRFLPIRVMTKHSKDLYPDIPHSWLCDGKLLRLKDPTCPANVRLFQEQWKRGQPVIVSKLNTCIDMDLWRPESFARDFGEDKNDLINCITGTLVPNQPLKRFWEGFDNVSRRLKDDKGAPMLLKLKDWPPGEDFAEIMPQRFTNLMQSLPLADYTQRSGKFNLASRLPDCFVKPDLGPKLYNAYGSAMHPTKGTTNLHLDTSDAVNLMVYVGIPQDGTGDEQIKEAYRAIDEAGCDILTRRRVRDKQVLPGALWHVFAPCDADKIRDLLKKVAVERGGGDRPKNAAATSAATIDPIHDQTWYLDGPLRERLYKEYMVEGYAIAQCLGDAVFIPAGAPHQVRNLHNCIKVAEDFVSPENVAHCFHLTQEFRQLSNSHSNHEDKLQIKNIIYHAIKDAVAFLMNLGKRVVDDAATAAATTKLNDMTSIDGKKVTDCDDKKDNNLIVNNDDKDVVIKKENKKSESTSD